MTYRNGSDLGFDGLPTPSPDSDKTPPLNPCISQHDYGFPPPSQNPMSLNVLLNPVEPLPPASNAAPLSTDVVNNLPAPAPKASLNKPKQVSPRKQAPGGRSKFTLTDLRKIAEAVTDADPFSAPHREKRKAWTAINQSLELSTAISDDLLRQKAFALSAYHTDPDSKDSKVKAIASVFNAASKDNTGPPESVSVTFGALLENLTHKIETAKSTSDGKKDEASKKAEEDRVGGDEIRKASMAGLRRKRSESLSASSDDDSSSSADDKTSTSKKIQAKKPPAKRQRLADRREAASTARHDKFMDLVHQRNVADAEFADRALKQQSELINTLRAFTGTQS